MYAVGFPGIADLVVWPESSFTFYCGWNSRWPPFDKVTVKQIRVKHFFFIILDKIEGDSWQSMKYL